MKFRWAFKAPDKFTCWIDDQLVGTLTDLRRTNSCNSVWDDGHRIKWLPGLTLQDLAVDQRARRTV
jgi:hypothetical protein